MIIVFSFPQNICNSEEEAWKIISNYLDCFLIDPLNNLQLIDKVDDLQYWTSIYYALNGKRYLEELFSNQFLASDVNEVELDVIFNLLEAFSSPTSYELINPIISRIIEISSMNPDWFALNLLQKDNCRNIAKIIIEADIQNKLGQRNGLKDILTDLKDSGVKKEVIALLKAIEDDNKMELVKFQEFIKDPSGGAEKIKDIYNICSVMARYENIHLDESKILWPQYNSSMILEKWIKSNIDENNIKILFQILTHCDSAYHQGMLSDIVIDVFLEHQPIFISVLKDEPNWRSIIFNYSDVLYFKDKDFKKTISTLGNTDFEMKIRYQLEFLRKRLKYNNEALESAIENKWASPEN